MLIIELHLSICFFCEHYLSICLTAAKSMQLLFDTPPASRKARTFHCARSVSPSLQGRNKSVTVVHHERSWVGIFHPSKQNGGMRTIARGASKGSRQRKPTSADQDPVSMHACMITMPLSVCPRAPCTTYSRMMVLCAARHPHSKNYHTESHFPCGFMHGAVPVTSEGELTTHTREANALAICH